MRDLDSSASRCASARRRALRRGARVPAAPCSGPSRCSTASAARSPDSQAPPTVPHNVSCTASPANQTAFCTGSISDAARALPARRRRRKRAKRQRLVVPARGVRALDRLLHVRAVKAREPVGGEIDHRGFAVRREFAAEFPATSIRQSCVPETLARIAAVCASAGLLEHEIVALEPERIAGEFERDVIVAAERKLAERFELALARVRA